LARRTIDPTRTALLRRKFLADINRRLRLLAREITQFIVDEDAFGLAEPQDRRQARAAGLVVLQHRAFAFRTNPRKVAGFRQWLQDRINQGILSTTATGQPWTQPYIESAYRKGVVRAYIDAHKADLLRTPTWYQASREVFLRTAFSQPETTSKLELLGTRAFEQLRGISATMSQQMSRVLADGLAAGLHPRQIARGMRKVITAMSRTRARMIARTEIVHAHAEGQLDAFSLLRVPRLRSASAPNVARWKAGCSPSRRRAA